MYVLVHDEGIPYAIRKVRESGSPIRIVREEGKPADQLKYQT